MVEQTAHITSTGEIKSDLSSNNWKAGYDPQQALSILSKVQDKLSASNTAVQKLVPELGGAVTDDAAVAVREVTYLTILSSYVLSSLGVDPSSFLPNTAVSEKTGLSVDYTTVVDNALQNVLGPNYAQYVGKPLPSIVEQQQSNQDAANATAPMHVIVDNLK